MEIYLESSDAGDTSGSFSREESSQITKLKAGLDSKSDGGYSTTSKPLQELQSKNPEGYAQVCYEIGMAYWYDYEVERERYKNAVEWFEEARDYYDTAAIFVEIGQCRQNISKYEGQSRVDDMNKEYASMWAGMKQLVETIAKSSDEDTRRLVWREVVNTISEQAIYFTEISEEDMKALLESIREEAEDMYENTKYPAVQTELEELRENIEKAESRMEEAKK